MIARARRRLLAIATLALVPVQGITAHPIHTTMTAVTMERGALQLMVRAFADDLSASVATFVGQRPPADWSVTEANVRRYLDARLRVADSKGRLLPLETCGVRRERELYWLCVRVPGATSVNSVRLENQLLTERHTDQVNIVQVGIEGSRRTLLFTKKSEALALAR